MNMLAGNPQFAEQLIRKYSQFESYYFDDTTLVFYKDAVGAGGGASSAYNTELTLKLLLMFQNYKQSGQRLHINWNMINNAVMKTAAGMSRQMEHSIREVISRSENRLEIQETRLGKFIREQQGRGAEGSRGTGGSGMQQSIIGQHGGGERQYLIGHSKSGEQRDNTGHSKSGERQDSRSWYGNETQQAALQDVILELMYKNTIQTGGGQARLRIIGSIGRERLKLRLSRTREETVRTEHIIKWINSLKPDEAALVCEAAAWASPKLYRQMRHLEETYIRDIKASGSGRGITCDEEDGGREGKDKRDTWEKRERSKNELPPELRQIMLIRMAGENPEEFLRLVKGALNDNPGYQAAAGLVILTGRTLEAERAVRSGSVSPSEAAAESGHIILSDCFIEPEHRGMTDKTVLEIGNISGRKTQTLACLFRKYEEQIFTGSARSVPDGDSEVKRRVFKNIETIIDSVHIRPETAVNAGKELIEILRDNYRTEGNSLLISEEDVSILELSENAVRVFRENPQALSRVRDLINRVDETHRERLRVWSKSLLEQEQMIEQVMTVIERRFGSPKTSESEKITETVHKAGKELTEILKSVMEHNHRYHSQNEIWNTSDEIWNTSKDAVTVLRENSQPAALFWELISRAEGTQREQLKEWTAAWGHTEESRPLASRVTTIMESRFSEPGLAKQAEKELFDILLHDLSIEESQLVLKKEGGKEKGREETRSEYEKMRLFLSSRENVELMRRRIEGVSAPRLVRLREWVNRYQNVISEQKEKTRLEETRKLISESRTETVLRLLQSENRLEREKKELVTQVKRTLGEDAAHQLEHYFNRKNQVTGQELTGQTEKRTEETVKNIINAYVGITRKEDTLTRLNPGSYVHLENRMRADVHEPVSKTVGQTRRNLEILTSMMRRDYDFNREQSRFFTVLTERIGETAETVLLRREPETGRQAEDGARIAAASWDEPESMMSYAHGLEQNRLLRAGSIKSMRLRNFEQTQSLQVRNLEKTQLLRIRNLERMQQSGMRNAEQMRLLQPRDYDRLIKQKRLSQPEPYHQAQTEYREPAQNGLRSEWGEAKTEFLRRQSRQESRIEETRTTVRKLNEKLELQEKLVAELKKQPRQPESAPQLNINVLTKQIMKKMESELRLEKMRRGLL